jgi:hypothetical protein
MSASTLRIVVAVVLTAHGIGHALAILPVFGVKLSDKHSPSSWILTGLLGGTLASRFGFLIWISALMGFVGAGLGLLGWLVPTDWWQPLAIGAAITSLLGLFIFWNAFPFFFPNKVGVVAVDVATIFSSGWLERFPGGMG